MVLFFKYYENMKINHLVKSYIWIIIYLNDNSIYIYIHTHILRVDLATAHTIFFQIKWNCVTLTYFIFDNGIFVMTQTKTHTAVRNISKVKIKILVHWQFAISAKSSKPILGSFQNTIFPKFDRRNHLFCANNSYSII